MKKLISKILKDTLTSPKTGKYSRKSMIMFVSFNFCLICGIVNLATGHTIQEFIFFSFLAMAGGQTVLTVVDKYKNQTK